MRNETENRINALLRNGLGKIKSGAANYTKNMISEASQAVGKQLVEMGKDAVLEFGKTQAALSKASNQGFRDLNRLKAAAVDFSNTWAGTTREEFIEGASQMKASISSLSEDGAVQFAGLSALTAKAAESSTADMTALFAQGYDVYRKLFSSDMDFGQAFAAAVAKAGTQGGIESEEIRSAMQSLARASSSTGLSVTGLLSQPNTMAQTGVPAGLRPVESTAGAMNSGVLDKMERIRQTWANVLDQVGAEMVPGILPALDDLENTLIRLQQTGDLSRLGASLGQLAQAAAALFGQILEQAPGTVKALADAVQWLADNLGTVIFALKTAAAAWTAFKAASTVISVVNGIKGIINMVTSLGGRLAGCRTLMGALKAALSGGFKATAIGLAVTAVIGLVSWIAKATDGVSGFGNKWNAVWLDAQDKFHSAVLSIETGLQDLLSLFGVNIEILDKDIEKNKKKIAELRDKKAALKDENKKPKNNIVSGLIGKAMGMAAQVMKDEVESGSASGGGSGAGAGSAADDGLVGGTSVNADYGYSGTGAKTVTIQDRIDAIEDKYAPSVENMELKADLAAGDNKTGEAKTMRQGAIDYLNQQAADLLRLEGTQSGDNRTIVDNARLGVMKKIQQLTQDIRDGVDRLTGEFNKPSDIAAMTKYEYMAQRGGTVQGQYFSNGNVEMYFNIKNPDALSAEKLEAYIRNWAVTGAVNAGSASYSQAKEMANQMTRY